MNENGKGEIAQYHGHFMTKFGYGTIIVPFLVLFVSISGVFGLANEYFDATMFAKYEPRLDHTCLVCH